MSMYSLTSPKNLSIKHVFLFLPTLASCKPEICVHSKIHPSEIMNNISAAKTLH